MQRIVFLPRFEASCWVPKENSVLISIHDIGEKPLRPEHRWSEILYLQFNEGGVRTDGKIFDLEKAKCVLEFVEKHKDTEELVVNCQMGQFRSAAIALYISEKYRTPCFKKEVPVSTSTWKFYSRNVYSRLSEAEQDLLKQSPGFKWPWEKEKAEKEKAQSVKITYKRIVCLKP